MIKGKIGIELEGFIPNEKTLEFRRLCIDNGLDLGSDGSVCHSFHYYHAYTRVSNSLKAISEKRFNSRNYDTCEIRGRGFVFPFDRIEEFYTLINKIFDLGFRVNSSCGCHIHLSFENMKDYYKLMKWNFIETFQEKLKDLFKTKYEKLRLFAYYSKLYTSQLEFENAIQNQTYEEGKANTRYYSVNFNSFPLYRTIEFRIFPSTCNIEKLKKYCSFLLNIVEEFTRTNESIKLSMDKTIDKIRRQHNKNKKIIIKIQELNGNTTQQEQEQGSIGV